MSPFATIRRLRRGPFTPGLAAALAAGVILHIAGIALIGATWRLPAPPEPPGIFVQAAPANSMLNEKAELLDPSPLFLPTALNHGAGYKIGNIAPDEPPLPAPKQNMPPIAGVPLKREPVSPVLTEKYAKRPPDEQLPRTSGDTFLVFGRTSPDTTALAPVGARIIIRDEATGAALGEEPIEPGEIAPSPGVARAPAEFFVESDAYGISPPVLRKSSGDRECDRRLAEAVAARLAKKPPAPGRMLITASP